MARPSDSVVRLAIGLRSTAEGLGWIARECGIFEWLGIDFRIVRMETAGPLAVAGLANDEWDFADVGALPIVQAVLRGEDPVIVVAPEPISAVYVLARSDITSPEALSGGHIGVLSVNGQTGASATIMIDRWKLTGHTALTELKTYPRVYAALCAGEIEAGVLSADYRFAGERACGLHALADIGTALQFQGPIVATTRRFIAANRPVVEAVVRGYVEVIHLFKTDRGAMLPLLKRLLGFEDDAVIAALYDFYQPRFQTVPRPSLAGLQRIISESAGLARPTAAATTPDDIVDLSFLDAIERGGTVAAARQERNT